MHAADIGIIFDMDGVLIDSIPHFEKSFNHVFQEHGVSVAELNQHHGDIFSGHSLREILDLAYQSHGLSLNIEEVSAKANAVFMDIVAMTNVVADPALVRLLSELQGNQAGLAVASNSLRHRVRKIVEFLRLDPYFKAVLGVEDAALPKPHPDLFLAAAEMIKVKPERCIVFEDTAGGIAAAKAAGMKAIGYTRFSTQTDRLTDADRLAGSFSELTIHDLFALLNT
ncbi:MAG: hypothetical protein COU11_00020 [Candidatus Harrisonbacteria bacterium CG10_big_fil_rev_8_21_14_0_10_49_15]|uniref:HAD family phosphatase n=1 Tax=Candidatus Harrisonbacteria bacterium CG10_big_fil_rev_8_21_14_0_10_49_15 TaxID=1974587 RepID=A0A2H0UM42_9BACT|nr:MAG: hypothetical protein COU11_00020 [Candidatus Harrisonbacteria bacterium CG10_big_fil_rev_8_21_14_0_10_49_15]